MNKGDVFTHEFSLTDKIYEGFIELFQDRNPLHTNDGFAQSKGFDGKVMHGNILGGFLSYFIGECLPRKNVIIHSQEIRYVKPAYMNQKLNFQAEVSNVFESVNAIEFKFKFLKAADTLVIAKGKIQIGII